MDIRNQTKLLHINSTKDCMHMTDLWQLYQLLEHNYETIQWMNS